MAGLSRGGRISCCALRVSGALAALKSREGQRSLTNIVSVIMHAVRQWLRMPDKGSARPTKTTGIRGGQKNDPYPLDRAG